jgi:hypothetical protein
MRSTVQLKPGLARLNLDNLVSGAGRVFVNGTFLRRRH